jgi:hypothetical protein
MSGNDKDPKPYDPEEDSPKVYAKLLGGMYGPRMSSCYHLANPQNTRQETCPNYPTKQGDRCIDCAFRLGLGDPQKVEN